MNLLLDTHVLLWAFENSSELAVSAREAIIDGNNLVFVSSATIWEISIKKAIGKLEVPDNLFEEMKDHRFTPLNIEFEHSILAGALPFIHKDPFDRMLVAQAMVEKLTIITRDDFIPKYHVNVLKT